MNDCEVGRRLGVPRRTVRDWRIKPSVRRVHVLGHSRCLRRPTTSRARPLNARWTATHGTARPHFLAVIRNKVGRQFPHDGHMVTLHAYHGHWTCLLPQHGPGKKHERDIVLETVAELSAGGRTLVIPAWLHPVGWLLLHQPHRQVRVRVLRLRKRLAGHPRSLRLEVRSRRRRIPPIRQAHQDLSEGERCADARARRTQGVSRPTLDFARHCGCGGIRQTRGVQVAVSLRSWRFESSQPHRSAGPLLPCTTVPAAIV